VGRSTGRLVQPPALVRPPALVQPPALVRPPALAQPAAFIRSLALAFAGGYGLNAATALAFLPFGRTVALTTGLLSGNRNMSLYLAVLPATTDHGVLLFLALCQFPLLLSPFLLRPLYRRLMR